MAENILDKYDVIVIGKGPAGIQAAIYTQCAGFTTLVIGEDAGALEHIDVLKNYYGFADPVSGPELLNAGLLQAERLGIDLLEAEVTSAAAEPEGFRIKTDTAEYFCEALIIAVGMSPKKSSIEGVAGITGRDLSQFIVSNTSLPRGREVAVLGTDHYALNEARELSDHLAAVTILTNNQTPKVDFEAYDLPICPDRIVDLKRDDAGALSGIVFEGGKTLPVEDLVICEGKVTAVDLAVKLGLDLDDGFPRVDSAMRSSLSGVFVAGNDNGGNLQVATAVGRGAAAGLEANNWLRLKRGDKVEKAQWG